jgi:hypothetical protein
MGRSQRRQIVFGALALTLAGAAALVLAMRQPARVATAPSADAGTLRQRCVDELEREYHTSTNPRKIYMSPRIIRQLGPRICALAERRGLLDGGVRLASADAQELTTEAIGQIGVARFQTILFTELAVSQYHLARSARRVTRLDRCVAMGLSAYDADHETDPYPPRPRWAQAVRRACATGIRRGLVPASGAPREPVVRALMDEALATG